MTVIITQINQYPELLDEVIALGDLNKKYLGFLPDGAFREIASKGHILVAINTSFTVLGYLIYRIVSSNNNVSIVHLCVDETRQGKGIAEKLVDELKEISSECTGIGLFCRRDFPSNKFWSHIGFKVTGEKKGRGKKQLPLTHYWFDHGQPTIFSQADKNRLNDANIKAVIDANVFFNLLDQDSHPLLSDWITSDDLILTISSELQNEIQRDDNDERRSQAFSYAQHFPIMDTIEEEKLKIYQLLRGYYSDDLTDQNDSDIKQVTHAASAKASFFITKDETLKSKLKNIVKEVFQLSIVSPDELVIHLDQLLNKEKYKSVQFNGTDLDIHCLKSDEVEEVAEIFHRINNGRKNVFRKQLELYLNDPQKYEVYIVSSDEKLIAITAISYAKSREIEIPLFRVNIKVSTSKVEFQLLFRLVSIAVKKKLEVVRFTDKFIQEGANKALIKNNFFLNKEADWIKFNLNGIYTESEIRSNLLERGSKYKSSNEVLKVANDTISRINEHGEMEDVVELEKLFWPLKISSYSVTSYIVPIKPVWAVELFDSKLGEQSLFSADSDLILQIENVYYRSAQPKVPVSPSRILWYVSKGEGSNNWLGTSAIRACSYVEKLTIGTPKQLFKEFSKLGVYNWDNIVKAAGGDLDKEILAFHFSRTELFDHPVSLNKITEITGRNSAPISPVTIKNEEFLKLYKLGLPNI